MAKAFGYKVVELRENVIGGKMLGDKLEKVLNEHGRQGWQLKSVTAVEVKGRLGPGGVEGSRDIRTDEGLTATYGTAAGGGGGRAAPGVGRQLMKVTLRSGRRY